MVSPSLSSPTRHSWVHLGRGLTSDLSSGRASSREVRFRKFPWRLLHLGQLWLEEAEKPSSPGPRIPSGKAAAPPRGSLAPDIAPALLARVSGKEERGNDRGGVQGQGSRRGLQLASRSQDAQGGPSCSRVNIAHALLAGPQGEQPRRRMAQGSSHGRGEGFKPGWTRVASMGPAAPLPNLGFREQRSVFVWGRGREEAAAPPPPSVLHQCARPSLFHPREAAPEKQGGRGGAPGQLPEAPPRLKMRLLPGDRRVGAT